ncbi:MAG: hypothetical protein ACOH5I_15910 [Oligoflexus sp.]
MKSTHPSHEPALIQAIEQIWQRVIALELSFKSFDLADGLNKKQLGQITNLLASTKDRLARMKAVLEAEADLEPILKKLEFPPYQHANSQETAVLIKMIEERRRSCTDIVRFLASFHHWLVDAARGKAQIRVFWRLQKLKKYFDMIRQSRFDLDMDQDSLQNNIRQCLKAANVAPKEGDMSPDEALQHFHASLHALLHSTQRLEDTMHNEQRQVLYMKNWLVEARSQARGRFPDEPPKLQDLRVLNNQWDHYGFNHYHDTRKRLTIARDYVEHFLKQLRYIDDDKLWPTHDLGS